jgi:glycolate dehydrogenase FAD-binding subunit
MDLIHPHTKADVAEALREATAAHTPLLVVGGRQHMDRGNPSLAEAELWTTQLDRLVSYAPEEMLAVVEGGMRAHDLALALAERGQEWPADAPPDATVGGTIAAGVSSVRRARVGHVRDSVVEMELVTGDGRAIRSGARTVKNVTGYDVHRLMTGSLGTLGVIVQVALKLRPLPEAVRTLRAEGSIALATSVGTAAPSAAAVLAGPEAVTVRLEGWRSEVEEVATALRELAAWEEVEALPTPPDAATLLEVAVPPSCVSAAVEGSPAWLALPGVGLAWIAAGSAETVDAVRTRVAALGGIAPAVHGPGGLGSSPLPAPEVQRRLKEAFDPAGVLAPGRAWGGY